MAVLSIVLRLAHAETSPQGLLHGFAFHGNLEIDAESMGRRPKAPSQLDKKPLHKRLIEVVDLEIGRLGYGLQSLDQLLHPWRKHLAETGALLGGTVEIRQLPHAPFRRSFYQNPFDRT